MLEGKRIGLVLCGGGGKGSYQIGVWKALKEAGITVSAIAGTSVGALNGAMMIRDDYAAAENIWENIRQDDVLSLNSPTLISNLAKLHIDFNRLPVFLRTKGLFSKQGLMSMMDQALPPGFATSPIPLYAALHDKAANQVEYKRVNNCDDETARKVILASAALPGIFDDIELDDTVYTDGGWFWDLPHKNLDNAPIAPLFEKERCDIIFLVCLSRDDRIERNRFPGVKLLPIVPTMELGGLFSGVMDFNGENARKRIEQGYRDARAILQSITGFLQNSEEYEKLWQRFAEGEAGLTPQRERIDAAESEGLEIRKQIKEFNRIVLQDDFTAQMEWANEAEPGLLEIENRLLLTRIDRHEQLELSEKVDQFLARNRDNGRDIEDSVLDAVSCLAAVPGQSNHLAEQGVLSRFWNSVTGKNQKLIADNQHDLAMAQYAALRLISQVQRQQLLSFESTLAIGNKVNWLFGEVVGLSEELNRRTVSIYRSMAGLYLKLRSEIRKDRGRIDKLEQRVVLLEWLTTVESTYCSLPAGHRLMALVNEFYRLTAAAWNPKEIHVTLQQALRNAGFRDERQLLAPKELFSRNAVVSLFHGVTSSDKGNLSPLLDTAELVKRNDLDGDEAAGGWLAIRHGMTADIPMPVYDLAIDLLHGLKRGGFALPDSVDPMKEQLLDQIKLLEDVAAENELTPFAPGELDGLRESVAQYKFAVPVIGPFNAGKSTLLNCYMGFDQKNELLKSDQNRETKVATELHYTCAGEKVVLHFMDGTSRSYATGCADETLPSLLNRLINEHAPAGNLLYVEAHVNNQALAEHPELILVDMPGLSSGLEAHNRAILNYMDSGTSFILCTSGGIKDDTLQFIKDLALYELDFRVVITKKDDRIAEEHEEIIQQNRSTLAHETNRRIPIVSVESHKKELAEFRDLIDDLSARRSALFRKRFNVGLTGLAARLTNSLKMLLNGQNLSTSDLEEKKGEIQRKVEELERKLAKICKAVRHDCSVKLPGEITADVASVLNQNRSSLKNQMLNGGNSVEERISGLAANEYQLSIGKRARELFSAAEKEIDCYVETTVYANEGGLSVTSAGVEDVSSGNGGLIAGGLAGVGLLTIGFPVLGAIVAIGIYFFGNSDKESEAESALATAFEQILSNVRSQAVQQLGSMADRFLAGLSDKVAAIKKDQSQTLNLLEAQLEKCTEEKMARHDKISGEILRIAPLCGAPVNHASA